MDLRLTGKRAMVTGSSGGIGEGIAKMLAREGAAVVVQGRNESAGRRVQQQIEAAGGKAVVAIGDLSTDDGAKRVVDKSVAEFGAIDILVNNAGAYELLGWADAHDSAMARHVQSGRPLDGAYDPPAGCPNEAIRMGAHHSALQRCRSAAAGCAAALRR